MDVGNVRHWPRMTRDQLAKVFPNGRTLHLSTDGPLPGYELAHGRCRARRRPPSAADQTPEARPDRLAVHRLPQPAGPGRGRRQHHERARLRADAPRGHDDRRRAGCHRAGRSHPPPPAPRACRHAAAADAGRPTRSPRPTSARCPPRRRAPSAPPTLPRSRRTRSSRRAATGRACLRCRARPTGVSSISARAAPRPPVADPTHRQHRAVRAQRPRRAGRRAGLCRAGRRPRAPRRCREPRTAVVTQQGSASVAVKPANAEVASARSVQAERAAERSLDARPGDCAERAELDGDHDVRRAGLPRARARSCRSPRPP